MVAEPGDHALVLWALRTVGSMLYNGRWNESLLNRRDTMPPAPPTPIPETADDAVEFESFAFAVEPELRKALVGTFGLDGIDSLVADALEHAWKTWPRSGRVAEAVPALFSAIYQGAARPEAAAFWPQDLVPVEGVHPDLPAALATMDEPHRSALWLTYGCGWSVAATAQALDRGVPMIGSYVGAGLGSLRSLALLHDATDQIRRLCEASFATTAAVSWRPSAHEPTKPTRWKVPALVVAAVLAAAAIVGPRLATTPTFDLAEAEQALNGAPTPLASTGSAGPAEPALVPTPVPTAPALRSGRFVGDAQIIGDRLIVVDSNEVWTSTDRASSWQRLAYPEGAVYDSYSSCFSAIDERLVVSTIGSGSRKLFVEQPDQRTWDVITVPAAPERANWYWGNRLCRPIEVDGAWVLATTERDGLRIASTRDRGRTFVQHQILFPPEWVEIGTDFGLGGFVNLYLDHDWIVAQICISRSGGDCPSQEVTFHSSLLAPGTEGEILHDARNSRGQPMLSWNTSRRTYTEEIELFQVDSAVWRTEVGDSNASLTASAQGTWASGPFDGPLTPLPGRPSLYPTDGGVVACVHDDDECWIRGTDDVEWQRLAESPVVDWQTLPPGTPATFSDLAADGTVLVVPYSPTS